TMRLLSVSVLMRKLSAKVRPRFSHIAAAIALRSSGDFSGKASSRFASARFCRPRRGAIRRQSFPESHEAACKGIARAMTIANQKPANSSRRRRSLGSFMRRATASIRWPTSTSWIVLLRRRLPRNRGYDGCDDRRIERLEIFESDEIVKLGPCLHLRQHGFGDAIASERRIKLRLQLSRSPAPRCAGRGIDDAAHGPRLRPLGR